MALDDTVIMNAIGIPHTYYMYMYIAYILYILHGHICNT